MFKTFLLKLRQNPGALIKNGFLKYFIFPAKYRHKGSGYDAARYWQDRFQKYGKSLKGVGDEGLSEEQNQKMYAHAASVFQGILQGCGIDLRQAKVLEIGCGTGFFTGIVNGLGVNDYTGLDITDVLFDDLTRKFPRYKFFLKDITQAILPDKYDLIIMIDVLEHIVDEPRFNFAMDSIRQALTDSGIFLAGPLLKKRQKHLFHVHFWTVDDIRRKFFAFLTLGTTPFRNGFIVCMQNKK